MLNNVTAPEYVQLFQIIKAEDLLKRWPGCSQDDLVAHIGQGRVQCYWHSRSLRRPDGKIIHFCRAGAHPDSHGLYGTPLWDGEWDWNGIVFSLDSDELVIMEIKYPEYRWQPVSIDPVVEDDEWVAAEEARRQLQKTPMEFLSILESGDLETDIQENYREYQFSGLNDFFITLKCFPP